MLLIFEKASAGAIGSIRQEGTMPPGEPVMVIVVVDRRAAGRLLVMIFIRVALDPWCKTVPMPIACVPNTS